MYKLYYAEDSAAMGIRVLLEEIGAAYELIPTTIDMTKPRPPVQLALNPNGWVPVLLWDDDGQERAMYEAAAITIFLCDRHAGAGLAPGVDTAERGRYLQTLVYFSSSVQNAFQLNYYPDRFVDAPEDEPSAQRRGHGRLSETLGIIDAQIGDGAWVLGAEFSALDVYLFMLTTWMTPDRRQPQVGAFANVQRIARKVAQRPSVRLVYERWLAEHGHDV